MTEYKHKRIIKFENIYSNVLEDILRYEIYSLLPLNKTVQRNSQHCTKLHNELRNVLHNKII